MHSWYEGQVLHVAYALVSGYALNWHTCMHVRIKAPIQNIINSVMNTMLLYTAAF